MGIKKIYFIVSKDKPYSLELDTFQNHCGLSIDKYGQLCIRITT